jgi:hypothetical protein
MSTGARHSSVGIRRFCRFSTVRLIGRRLGCSLALGGLDRLALRAVVAAWMALLGKSRGVQIATRYVNPTANRERNANELNFGRWLVNGVAKVQSRMKGRVCMRSDSGSSIDAVRATVAVAVCLGTLAFVALLVEWPTLVWSSLQFHPALVNPALVAHAALSWLFTQRWSTPASWAGIVPPFVVGLVLDACLVVALGWLTVRTIVHVNRWGGRSRLRLHPQDPRRKVNARAFATPLDWAHLQPAPAEARSGPLARVVSGPARALAGEHDRPSLRGGDGWNMGLVRGQEVRSGPEQHMLAIAPTRSGKSMRIVGTEARSSRACARASCGAACGSGALA